MDPIIKVLQRPYKPRTILVGTKDNLELPLSQHSCISIPN